MLSNLLLFENIEQTGWEIISLLDVFLDLKPIDCFNWHSAGRTDFIVTGQYVFWSPFPRYPAVLVWFDFKDGFISGQELQDPKLSSCELELKIIRAYDKAAGRSRAKKTVEQSLDDDGQCDCTLHGIQICDLAKIIYSKSSTHSFTV